VAWCSGRIVMVTLQLVGVARETMPHLGYDAISNNNFGEIFRLGPPD